MIELIVLQNLGWDSPALVYPVLAVYCVTILGTVVMWVVAAVREAAETTEADDSVRLDEAKGDITAAIAKLPKTPSPIAEFLRTRGIKGVPGCPFWCSPLTQYLPWVTEVSPAYEPDAEGPVLPMLKCEISNPRSGIDARVVVVCPPAVLEFIERFDLGEYPDLVDEELEADHLGT